MKVAGGTLLVAVVWACGCGSGLPQVADSATWPGLFLPVLIAASADPSAEIAGPLPWDPDAGLGAAPAEAPPSGEPLPVYSSRARLRRWGVEAGAFIPLDGESQSYDGGLIGAACLRIRARAAQPWGLELGIGYTSLAAEDVDASTSLLLLRARALYALKEGGVCLALGAQVAHQQSTLDGGSLDAYTGATVDVGAYYFFAGRYVIGLVYSHLVQSGNVPGALAATGGITF
jgi:hypothetical protein